ncbi:MAG: HDOD domain-containing protein [Gammaproteobacteria bacterium]|nr:HDOD domain-containing protein [Gammaproteobacteria bacterium]
MPVTIDNIVNDIDQLVSLPNLWVRINEMIGEDNCSVNALGQVISQDPGLTARLLSTANSAAFGLRTKVDSVAKAVNVVGLKRLRNLVLATAAVEAFEGIPNQLVTMENFWQHSIYCGLIAKFLGDEVNLPHSDSLFVAGLLHDLGQLLMCKLIPELERDAMMRAVEAGGEEDLHKAEQQLMGFDHAMVGGELAVHWHLPDMLAETMRCHHDVAQAQHFPKETAIVNIANSLAVLAELNTTEIAATDAPPIDAKAWEITGLDGAIIEPAVACAREQFNEMQAALFS